ncbi:receptor ligand binding region family protein [Paraburkholderia xenovorans LB400]|uniref:Amino acid/amide ABC transporter substrate-binding protein, HAAT family n=1 Tax=Paraburkholderia xenovorans (strain LB400) TaxID=266265 RepID=Q13GP9_PARXL|nr:ABC transporter substrate-binding protein [Paraburkholderia xenovorans]ABE36740.1 amino acid/amide ABC transporter substrate-binding protein, HAAT family [Paraburkholderia xenovorans LB400]AIP34441.1 receptor ligand binding region family protein [Paraburkholderia xenovorans LB400]
MQRARFVTIALVLTLACYAAAAEAVVKVGVVIPLSGMTSQIGDKVKAAYSLAQQEINAAGGINGEPLQFVFADHQGKPDVGAREAERLIEQDKVQALTGSYESGVTLAVAQVAERRKVPYLVPYSAADRITESGFRYTFRTRPPSRVWVDTMFDYLASAAAQSGKPFNTVAILSEDGAYGQGIVEDIRQSAAAHHKQIVDVETFHGGAQDLTAQISKIRASGADAILAASYLNDTMKAVQTMNMLQFRRPYMTIGTGEIDAGFFQLGPLAENQVGTTAWLPDIKVPGAADFAARVKNALKIDANDDVAYAYSSAYVYKEAVEAGKSAAPEAVRQALATHTFTSARANLVPHQGAYLKFDAKGQANTVILAAQAQGGRWVTVWPAALAGASNRLGQWVPGNR